METKKSYTISFKKIRLLNNNKKLSELNKRINIKNIIIKNIIIKNIIIKNIIIKNMKLIKDQNSK